MAFQKGVSIMKHVTQHEYILTISPLETAFIAHFSSIGGALATMTSHYLYATLQAHLTNVNGNGQILFSMHHYRHIRTRPFLYKNKLRHVSKTKIC